MVCREVDKRFKILIYVLQQILDIINMLYLFLLQSTYLSVI